VSKEMSQEGLQVTSIHGGMAQNKRKRAVDDFTDCRTHAIVATDVAARGLDIKGVRCVIHYDPPENGKSFKHRSGRTARAGELGNVVSLVQHPQKNKWSKIQKEVGLNVEYLKPVLDDLTQHEDISYIKPEKRKSTQQQRSKYSRGHQKGGGRRQGHHRGRSQSRGQRRNQSQSRSQSRSQSQRQGRNRRRSQY
jgi:superfamily II DNA/RNA helicase